VTRKEIVQLLGLRGREQQQLFAKAIAAREAHFGNGAVVRGVIEVASTCVLNCSYCPMRQSNRMDRYIYSSDEIVALARNVQPTGVRVLSLQAGDAPRTTRTVGEAIPRIREMFDDDLDVLLVLGDKTDEDYAWLREQGATSYILKYETSDEVLHRRHRNYPLAERLDRLQSLARLGYRVGTGTIVGLPGQTLEILAEDILLGQSLGVQMWSASPFVPAAGTPLADAEPGDVQVTLNAIAIARLLLPHALIPSVSALEKRSPGAQLAGFNAGANVMTVNFTPVDERLRYPIYGADRFVVEVEYAASVLRQAGLQSTFVA
jgi:biotin synthase